MSVLGSLELAESIRAFPAPLIFLDTAPILDILRAPFRMELQDGIVEAAATLVDDTASTPRRLWLVSSANVLREFHDNRGNVFEELRSNVAKVNRSIARLARVAQLVVPESRVAGVDWLDAMFQERVLEATDRFVASVAFFQGTPDCVAQARNRLWAGLPPASRSKQEFKDCEIFEEFLELARSLRAGAFDRPIVFVTSNAKDYGPAPDGHPGIAADLGDLNCQFAGNLAWARSIALAA